MKPSSVSPIPTQYCYRDVRQFKATSVMPFHNAHITSEDIMRILKESYQKHLKVIRSGQSPLYGSSYGGDASSLNCSKTRDFLENVGLKVSKCKPKRESHIQKRRITPCPSLLPVIPRYSRKKLVPLQFSNISNIQSQKKENTDSPMKIVPKIKFFRKQIEKLQTECDRCISVKGQSIDDTEPADNPHWKFSAWNSGSQTDLYEELNLP